MAKLEPTTWQQAIGRDTFLRHLHDQKAFDSELRKILADAAREADAVVDRVLGDGIGASVRRAQYQQSAYILRQIQVDTWADVTRSMTRHIAESSRLAVAGTMRIAEVLARADKLGIGQTFLYAARSSAENVRSRLINDIDLSSRVYKNRALSDKLVDRAVNRGILLNKSAREIARDVRGLIRPDTPGGVSYAARRLGRTEINNAFHTTTIRSVEDAPWVTGMRWNLSGSHPRNDECDDYSKEDAHELGPGIFPRGDVPKKPHPQCLCYLTTVAVEREEFQAAFLAGKYDSYLARVA